MNCKDLEGSSYSVTEALSSYLHVCLKVLQKTTEISTRVVASQGRFLMGSYQTQVENIPTTPPYYVTEHITFTF